MNAPIDLTDDQKNNYRELIRAAATGRLAIIATTYKGTGKPAIVLVGKNPKADGEFDLVPFGTMFTEDPADLLETPAGFGVKQLYDNILTITE